MNQYEVIIVGGSFAGLSAAMALGRSLRNTLIIDSGEPCNRQTPHSHNFLTQDGETPRAITEKAKQQTLQYDTVAFMQGLVVSAAKQDNGFSVELDSGSRFTTDRILFATGIKDIMPSIRGFEECWGISVLHCPYCHGYEISNAKTGILGNGESAYELSKLIKHWTNDLTIFTNGKAEFTDKQISQIQHLNIEVIQNEVAELIHDGGQLNSIKFTDGSDFELEALYTQVDFEQHCSIPIEMGCKLTDLGHIEVDFGGNTSVEGVFAAGDNSTPMRSISLAVANGSIAGAVINKDLISDTLKDVK